MTYECPFLELWRFEIAQQRRRLFGHDLVDRHPTSQLESSRRRHA